MVRCGPLISTTWLYPVGFDIPGGLKKRRFDGVCACASLAAPATATVMAVATKSRREVSAGWWVIVFSVIVLVGASSLGLIQGPASLCDLRVIAFGRARRSH